jgi:hypothetical protein
VHQVGHYPELHQDARSTKYKKILTIQAIIQFFFMEAIPLYFNIEVYVFTSLTQQSR